MIPRNRFINNRKRQAGYRVALFIGCSARLHRIGDRLLAARKDDFFVTCSHSRE